jgi:hypothetical protein
LKKVPEGWSVELKRGAHLTSYILLATPCKMQVGPFADKIELEVVTDDGQAIPTQSVTVEGRVTGGLEVLPHPVELASVAVGTTGRASFLVRTRSSAVLEGLKVVPDDPNMKVVDVRREAAGWRVDLERVINEFGSGECRGIVRAEPSGEETTFLLHWYGIAK